MKVSAISPGKRTYIGEKVGYHSSPDDLEKIPVGERFGEELWEEEKEEPSALEKAPLKSTRISNQKLQILLQERLERTGELDVPYGALAKDGVIEYNGVTFVCDYKRHRLCLGDVSNPGKCLRIPLEKGGCLLVNPDNIGDLSKAIGMFSPEDVKRILEKISAYNKAKSLEQEIEDEKNSLGKVTEQKIEELTEEREIKKKEE